MQLKSPQPDPGAKASPVTSVVYSSIVVLLVGALLCIPLAITVNDSPQSRSIASEYYNDIKQDLRKGDLTFSGVKAKAKQRSEELEKKRDTAEDQLEAAILLQKKHQEEDRAKREIKAKAATERRDKSISETRG